MIKNTIEAHTHTHTYTHTHTHTHTHTYTKQKRLPAAEAIKKAHMLHKYV